jgi:hypothetical protein
MLLQPNRNNKKDGMQVFLSSDDNAVFLNADRADLADLGGSEIRSGFLSA